MIKPKVVLLIFVSGKIVLTGAKVMVSGASWVLIADISFRVWRCGRRYTRRSTRSTPCYASSASRNDRVVRHSSLPTRAWGCATTLSFDWTRVDTVGSRYFGFQEERLPVTLSKKPAFHRLVLAHSPFPLPCTYILAHTILQNTYSWTFCPFVLVIALSMTVYSEAFDI
jgi:hypothetical protein